MYFKSLKFFGFNITELMTNTANLILNGNFA